MTATVLPWIEAAFALALLCSLYRLLRGPGFSVHEFLITLFLFLTAPVSANLLVKAALHLARTGPHP